MAARSFAALLKGESQTWEDAVYMEQEEMRAVRTDEWLYVEQFSGAPHYSFENELYDLVADYDEKINLIDDPRGAEVVASLAQKLTEFCARYAIKDYDLWNGGGVKSTTDKAWLWKDAWGEDWTPGIDQQQQSK